MATVEENAPAGTLVTVVYAEDGDAGDFGVVRYSLAGSNSAALTVDPISGLVTVADPRLLDREERQEFTVQVVATDGATQDSARTATVPVMWQTTNSNVILK